MHYQDCVQDWNQDWDQDRVRIRGQGRGRAQERGCGLGPSRGRIRDRIRVWVRDRCQNRDRYCDMDLLNIDDQPSPGQTIPLEVNGPLAVVNGPFSGR